MSALIILEHTVPCGYETGDYAQLFGNSGSEDIDWAIPLSSQKLSLFPGGAGIYGFGHAPWGHFRWGHAHSMRTPGWGHMPWGHFPWGHGTATIKATHKISECGQHKFAFGCFDEVGNQHTGTPEEVTIIAHIAPDSPTGLKKNSYNKTTGILTLDAA